MPEDLSQRLTDHDRKALLRFIRGRVRTDEDAEDILQDILAQTLSVSPLKPIEDLSAWLFRAARNRIVDWWRRIRTRADAGEVPLPTEEDDSEPVLPNLMGDHSAKPDHLYQREVVREAIVEALAKLPAAQREVFLLHELEGVSFKEMAEASGTPIGTLLARKKYAVDALKKALQRSLALNENDDPTGEVDPHR
jgi:RNA polymerase sigma factor (sigma-70 family)